MMRAKIQRTKMLRAMILGYNDTCHHSSPSRKKSPLFLAEVVRWWVQGAGTRWRGYFSPYARP
jgi:hypothetical protein